ncbi:hypothetical protein BH10BAC2_BH10BAC2_12400 [soil metagenome]
MNLFGISIFEIVLFIIVQVVVFLLWRRVTDFVRQKDKKQIGLVWAFIALNYFIAVLLFSSALRDGTFIQGETAGVGIPSYLFISLLLFPLSFWIIKIIRKSIIEQVNKWIDSDANSSESKSE